MLEINTEYHQGIMFIRLRGNLIKDTIDIFTNEVINRIIQGGIRNVVYNLKELKNIDITGISGLLDSYRLCNKNDGCVLVCSNFIIKNQLMENKLLSKLLEVSNEKVALKIINMRVR